MHAAGRGRTPAATAAKWRGWLMLQSHRSGGVADRQPGRTASATWPPSAKATRPRPATCCPRAGPSDRRRPGRDCSPCWPAASAADEEFLETALDDRGAVRAARAAAGPGCPARPPPGGTARAWPPTPARAAGLRPWLVASLPGDPDAAAARDGLAAARPQPSAPGRGSDPGHRGRSAGRVDRAVRPAGGAIAALPVPGPQADVHAGWRLAAVGQRDSLGAPPCSRSPSGRRATGRRPPGRPTQLVAACCRRPARGAGSGPAGRS